MVDEILRILIGAITTIITLVLFPSCASKPVTIYIPTPCTIETPIRPINFGDAYKNTLEILKYTEMLEETLKACKGA